MYKQNRRREYERLKLMDEKAKAVSLTNLPDSHTSSPDKLTERASFVCKRCRKRKRWPLKLVRNNGQKQPMPKQPRIERNV